jgi:hypothetical protein
MGIFSWPLLRLLVGPFLVLAVAAAIIGFFGRAVRTVLKKNCAASIRTKIRWNYELPSFSPASF